MNNNSNEIIMTNANNYVTNKQIKNKKWSVFSTNAVIFAKVGEALYLKRMRIANNFLIDNNMGAFITSLNIQFIQELFYNIDFTKYVQVGVLPSLKMSDLNNIKIKLPSIEEQEKISNILSNIDKLITRKQNHLTQTIQYKTYLLQNMFI